MTLNLGILIVLIIGAFFSYISAEKDNIKKDEIEAKTDSLVKTGKETIDNLNIVSKDVLKAQEQANITYNKIKETYDNTIENLEKSDLNYKTNLENLERTLEAKNSILESQKDMISKLTGGDSYPYFTIEAKKLKLNINGKYSIPNLHFVIYFLKDYLLEDENNLKKYLFEGKMSTNILKINEGTIPKLFVNKNYNSLELSNVVLQSIKDDTYSGIDIKFTSEFKTWSQTIRLNKNILDNNIIEICNVIYELKDTKSENPFELAKRIKAESSKNFNLPIEIFQKLNKISLVNNLIIIYPKIEILDLKSSEIEKNLNYFNIDEFK
ncbi:hypothetical protein SAMN05444338_101177 [Flavobacterium degerlachei]|uniref:Uncharacterized protein n=2 Tax=Flavobacterium degerlachei TaxID=229203 RepID=A0A1H2QFT2_9FLAO|nr:hypothetical protein SAMN05444338_101177 [Flavobacterium degerlachei]